MRRAAGRRHRHHSLRLFRGQGSSALRLFDSRSYGQLRVMGLGLRVVCAPCQHRERPMRALGGSPLMWRPVYAARPIAQGVPLEATSSKRLAFDVVRAYLIHARQAHPMARQASHPKL